MESPIVSICCITYNHAPFIRKSLDGFLMQEPPTGVSKDEPWYEILIHDDASTDGTTEIIKEYAAKYPDKIFPLYEKENQYSKGHVADIDQYNYTRAKGKYIAYCEGDDYWTDAKKLQKQVDFMESHPEYSICLHGCTVYDTRMQKEYLSRDFSRYAQSTNKFDDGLDIIAKDYLDGYFGQPLTMIFRLSMYDFKWREQYKYYRDTHEIYHLLKAGRGYWMNFDGGVYNLHGGGISASADLYQHCWEEREHVMELYLHNREDKELRAYLIEILLWNHDVFKREGRESKFFIVARPFWRCAPMVMTHVCWVALKRDMREWYKRLRRWWTKKRLQPIPVYCFHQVSEQFDASTMYESDWTQIEQFKQNILRLKQRYTFISLPDAYDRIKRDWFRVRKYAVLTADDGWESLQNILPWIAQQQIPVTLFVNPAYLRGEEVRENNMSGLLSMQELQSLLKKYSNISIASHGWNHCLATSQSIEEFSKELDKSIEFLSQCKEYIPFYAYPCGRYKDDENRIVWNRNHIPAYCDGQANYNDTSVIHREPIDGKIV